MEGCVFCAILAGRAPASIVAEDESCCAFMDIAPVNPGHVLIVPRQHVPDLTTLEPTVGAKMFILAQRIAQALRESGLHCDGVNLLLSSGRAAGQEVLHVHLHVIPRYWGDGVSFRFGLVPRRQPRREDLDEVAARIRNALS